MLDNVNLEANQHFNLTMHCFFVINVISFITIDITSYEAPAVGRARNTGVSGLPLPGCSLYPNILFIPPTHTPELRPGEADGDHRQKTW